VGSLLTGCGASADRVTMSAGSEPQQATVSNSNHSGIATNTYAVDDAEEVYFEEAKAEAEAELQTSKTDNITLLEEKLVYHCDLNIETLDYPATLSAVKDAIARHNGIIQSESENDSGRDWYYENYRKTSGTMHNDLQVRIPSAEYDSFLADLDGVGKITSKSTSVENISQQYYDTATQIEALQIQEKNLLSMMEKCETIEEMITVQERLTQVQYELNNLQTNKRYMDIDVAYSYVNLHIAEVMEYRNDVEPVKTSTFLDRLGNTIRAAGRGFLAFLEALLFLVIMLSPYLLIAGIICFMFRKRIGRFAAERKAEKEAQRAVRQMRHNIAMQQPAMHNSAQQDTSTQQEEAQK